MKNEKAKIISNKQIAPDFFKMTVASAYLAKTSKPGQFLEVRCSRELDPLLRRPLGIHRILKNGIEMLYEVVGKGTKILSQKRPDETVEILGPLGNGFILNPNRDAILIAGGIGVAPLLALAEKITDSAERTADRKKLTVIIGARSKSHINCESDFNKTGCKTIVCTDDGSKGKKGLVTDVLKGLFPRTQDLGSSTLIYACGPNPMLKAIWAMALEKEIPCQFSFESHMACGVGVCLGCPVKVRKGLIDFEYKMVCKDGPIFNAGEILW
jgi:dihydroorotate dehydrogenase electron transfer subunit